ncbi:MAG TPA: hypothetical protein VGB65_14705 [Allosphingosinicella sp.]|jgi:hypothetical protein
MRDLFKKAMLGSMIAGAALLVSACGGGEDASANNMAGNVVDDGLMATDNSAVDAMNGSGNLGMEAGMNTSGSMGTDMNTTGTTGTDMNATGTTGTDMNTTGTGTGTGNTTGM